MATARVLPWAARWRERVFRHDPADGDGVALGHSRIYILPTRRGTALIVTLAMMLVTSLNYSLALGFYVTFLLTGLVGAALLHTFRNLSGLVVRPGPAGETFAGGRLPFTLHLSGGARARTAIAVATRDGASRLLDIEAASRGSVELDVSAPHRGRQPLGRVTLSSDFPLGLWRAWAYAHFPSAGLVYPAPEPAAPPVPSGTHGGDHAAAGAREDADLAGLKAYQHGDPLQRVAWKAVAARRGWYTKAFDGAGGDGPVLLDYASLHAGLPVEARLSRLCAWVLACERAARPCALRVPGAHVPAGAGREHRRALLTALALFDAGRG